MELFKLFGTIALNNSEANEGIDETTDKAEKAHPKIAAAFSKIGNVAVKAGKVIASGLAVGATAIGALAKQSLDSYADYEQLVGGVETLFKESGEAVIGYANNAYKTAGLSANEYMETVTSFSASLLQGLDGDTAKAAEVANRAITDMSDNANKMGTDMSMIQNAYQGFAKQNYTMLDNLKLGYGGTQAEMARLINDSGVLGKSIEVTAETVNEVSFDKIIEAIGVVQDRMGITGTTAKEASETISGSISSMKSAWKNLLTGFADDSQDLGGLISNLVSSATTAAKNVVPRIAQIFSGISAALPQIFSVISAELPGFIESLLPGLVDGAVTLIMGLAGMLPSLVGMLFFDLPKLLTNTLSQSANPVVSFLGNLFADIGVRWNGVLLPAIKDVGRAFETLISAVQPIFSLFTQLLTQTTGVTSGFDIFHAICWAVYDALSFVADGIRVVAEWIGQHMPQIQATVQGVFDACKYTWDTIGQPIFDTAKVIVAEVAAVFAAKMPEIKEFVSQCFTDIQAFWENNLKPCFDAIGAFLRDTLMPVFEEVFTSFIKPAVDDAFTFIKDLWENTLKPVFTGITDFLTGVFSGDWKQAWNGIVSIVEGIFNGIVNVVKSPINQVINIVNSLILGLNKRKIPDWVPLVGGKSINIPTIPKLEEGGVLKKGQMGFLEGNGAEAVVPLDQNRAWISAVARDMKAETGVDNGKLQQLIDMLADFFPQLIEASGHDIVTNDGVIVAHYAPQLNTELGKISSRKNRGR